jgi:methionyl-tRNA formyltransferase
VRIVFFGSPAFSVLVVEALARAGHDIVGVVTQPDRPAGRGRTPAPTPVKAWAEARGVPALQPRSFRSEEAVARVEALAPEAIVVAAYGRILPASVLALPPRGCLNLHPSLLPRHRGPSPVAEALLQEDATVGVSVMLMDEGMDSGPVLAQEEAPVLADDTTESLTWRLFRDGAALMVRTLAAWERGEVEPEPQDHERATVSRFLRREDGEMDWTQPASRLAAIARAYHPWPGAHTRWAGQGVKLLDVSALPAEGAGDGGSSPGTVVGLAAGPARVGVVTGDGVLGILRLQLEGKRAVDVEEFLRGHPSFIGAVLPS